MYAICINCVDFMSKKLLLFDVDGTLVRMEIPAHVESFAFGFKKVYNIDGTIFDVFPFDGKTDRQIIFEVLQKKGLERDAVESKIDEMFKVMTDYVKKNMKKADVVILPGIVTLLKELQSLDYALGVLTGNVEDIANIKLEIAGLKDFFIVGAFGSETEKRYKLVDIANDRLYEKLGFKAKNSDIYVIGDTILDIEAGKRAEVNTIGVATGKYMYEDLEEAGAGLVLKDLEDTEKIVEFIEG